MLDVLDEHVELVLLVVVDDLVQAYEVPMHELLHDRDLLLDLVELRRHLDARRRAVHRPLAAEQRLVEDLRRILLLVVLVRREVYLGERPLA